MARSRASWRLCDYTNKIRAEVRDVDVTVAAPTFQALISRTFGSGMAIPHPSVHVKRKGETAWAKLSQDEMRRFWIHNGVPR